MTYPTKEAITTLNRVLHLPATGREQDWDIELADPDRTSEFTAYLENNTLNEDERRALMALILGSLEDLAQKEEVSTKLADRIKRLLRADTTLYADLIKRWGPREDDPDGFAISAMVGSLDE
jgi:hypothetical protein